jgi:hypothetical protein
MDLPFKHEMTYIGSSSASVADVAASLVANEQIVLEVRRLLEACIPGLTVESIQVEFKRATIESPLKELLGVSIAIGFQEELKKEIPPVVKAMFGIESSKYDTIITVLFVIIVIYGIDYAFRRFKSGFNAKAPAALAPESPAIEGNFNTVLNVGGDLIGVEPQKIREALDKMYPAQHKEALAKKALTFIRPAKRESGVGIEGGGVRVEPDTIADAPTDIDLLLDEETERQDPMENQIVVIHATDLDHKKSGWAGHIPGVWEKRLRMQIYPTIDVDALYGVREIRGDIILVSNRDAKGEMRPYMFHLVTVHETKS